MKKLLLACGLLAAPALYAQVAVPTKTVEQRPVSASDADYMAQESALVRKLRLLELQARVAEQERKISGADAPGADAVQSLPPLPMPIMRPGSVQQGGAEAQKAMPELPALPAPPESNELFSVASVWGVEGNYYADLLTNGVRISVRKGDSLPQGWSVVEVLRTGIVIEKGKKRKTMQVGR